MPNIKLTPEQVGEYDNDGNMLKRPTQDTLGNDLPGGTLHPTVKHIRSGGKLYFVTIPVGKDHPDNVYQVPGAPLSPVPAPKE